MKKIYQIFAILFFLPLIFVNLTNAQCTLSSGDISQITSNGACTSGTGVVTITGVVTVNSDYTLPVGVKTLIITETGQLNFGNNNAISIYPSTSIDILNTDSDILNGHLPPLVGACSANVQFVILPVVMGGQSTIYAVCSNGNAQGTCLSFAEFIKQGGTVEIDPAIIISGLESTNGNVCFNTFGLDVTLTTVNSGINVNSATYLWSQVSGPGTTAFSTANNIKNPTLTVTLPGQYLYRVDVTVNLSTSTCTTTLNAVLSNTVSVTVRPTPTASLGLSANTICQNTVGTATITNTNPTLSETIIYSINGINQTALVLAGGASSALPINTSSPSTLTYALVNAAYTDALPSCIATLSNTGQVATITGLSTISGSVLNDITKNSIIDGANATNLENIAYVSLLQIISNSIVLVSTAPVTSTGTFTLPAACNGEYKLVLHNMSAGSYTPVVPSPYVTFFGEGTAGTIGDGTPNGQIFVTLSDGAPVFSNARVKADGSVTFAVSNLSLPVRLINFTGKSTEKGNELTWKSSSEQNFSHFDIERSIDAKAFKKIGNLTGAKSDSKEVLDYSYLDDSYITSSASGTTFTNSSLVNEAYYRLKMVDLDGTTEYSKLIFIDNKDKVSTVGEFYPNPVSGLEASINILSDNTKLWTITAYDMTGRVINTETRQLQKGENKLKFDVKSRRNSIAIYRFESANALQFRKLSK